MKVLSLTVLFYLTLLFTVCGQKTIYFTDGLAAGPFHQYGREAIYKDELSYLLNAGQLPAPKEGSVSTTLDKKEVSWKSIKADTAHRFWGNELSNGYLYLNYDAPKAQTAILNVTGNDMVYVNGALLNGSGAECVGKQPVSLTLVQNGKPFDQQSIGLETIAAGKQYSRTFISEMDGTVQYY